LIVPGNVDGRISQCGRSVDLVIEGGVYRRGEPWYNQWMNDGGCAGDYRYLLVFRTVDALMEEESRVLPRKELVCASITC